MIFLLDNYDSFTYNVYQYLSQLGAEITVARNDQITVTEIEDMAPEKIVISPGPSVPDNAGISNEVVAYFAPKRVPILGICLGHQCIGQVFGGNVASAGEIMHGKTSLIYHDASGVFEGLKQPLQGIRYHSLTILPETMPAALQVTARTHNGIIMGVRHQEHPVQGIQFHPESIMTEQGHELLQNFLNVLEKPIKRGTD